MEYKKIIDLLDNAANKPPRFRTKTELKQMIANVELITLILKLNLKLQW